MNHDLTYLTTEQARNYVIESYDIEAREREQLTRRKTLREGINARQAESSQEAPAGNKEE